MSTLPASLEAFAEEARVANKMGDALLGGEQTYATYARARFHKSSSYTLAEKYNLLDLFPPTVTVVSTKIV